jgi:hypothetical protein
MIKDYFDGEIIEIMENQCFWRKQQTKINGMSKNDIKTEAKQH